MRILNLSSLNSDGTLVMEYAPDMFQDITKLAKRPHGLRQNMKASTIDIFWLPDRVRVINRRPEARSGYIIDIYDPGEYILGHFVFYRLSEIDPIKQQKENWEPWETHRDYMAKITKEDPESGFKVVAWGA